LLTCCRCWLPYPCVHVDQPPAPCTEHEALLVRAKATAAAQAAARGLEPSAVEPVVPPRPEFPPPYLQLTVRAAGVGILSGVVLCCVCVALCVRAPTPTLPPPTLYIC
jgi:hypothetical protein